VAALRFGAPRAGRFLGTANIFALGGKYSARHVIQAAIFSHPVCRHLPGRQRHQIPPSSDAGRVIAWSLTFENMHIYSRTEARTQDFILQVGYTATRVHKPLPLTTSRFPPPTSSISSPIPQPGGGAGVGARKGAAGERRQSKSPPPARGVQREGPYAARLGSGRGA
jgi:hypothetical protein